jgi:ABC-type nitrate/sulfonate/bicarbonate transport system permease component
MATIIDSQVGQSVPRRRPIERPLGWEGFWFRYGKLITNIINFSIFFLLWEVLGRSGRVSRLLLPPFSAVIQETIKLTLNGQLWYHMSFSAVNGAIGFLLATVTGIPIGLALGASKTMDRILGPYIWAMFSTPRLALLPLITVALGFGMASKVFLVFIGAFFVIVINTWAGVRTVEESLVKAGLVFGANRYQIFTKIVVPYTLPFIVVGLRLGVTRALVVNLVSEMIASSRGMGYVVMRAVDEFNSAKLFSMILLLVIISMILVSALRRLEAWVAPWREVSSV